MYKVVRSIDDILYSIGKFQNPNYLIYKKDKWVFPKFGRIFVFNDLKQAQNFNSIYCASNGIIYKCEVLGEPKEIMNICSDSYSNFYKDFWDSKSCFKLMPTPSGTYIVEAVKLLEKV